MNYPVVYPEIQAFIDASTRVIEGAVADVNVARANINALQSSTNPPLDSVDHEAIDIPVGPSGSLSAHIYKPKGTGDSVLPVLFYIHGGGWMVCNNITHQRLIMELVKESGAAVFFLNYTLCPEAVYPTQIEECYATLQWLYANGKTYGLNTERVAIAGDSAGGTLSIGVNILSLQRHTPIPRYQVLFVPVTDISKGTRTYDLFPQGPVVVTEEFRQMIKVYAPDASTRTNILASPVLATNEDLKGFPKTLIFVAEADPLREEGENFGRRLISAGVETVIFRTLGVIHGATILNSTGAVPAAKAEVELASLKIKKALFD